jgi:Ni,Fe-hydrogenase maturation factor
MIFNKSALKIYEQYEIKLTDAVLGKLEDAAKNNRELLITVDASHFGMKNGNGVYYRHDTVKNNIQSFIYPNL